MSADELGKKLRYATFQGNAVEVERLIALKADVNYFVCFCEAERVARVPRVFMLSTRLVAC